MRNYHAMVLAVIVFILPFSVYAEGMICIGMDGSGQTLHVIMDVDTGTLNINGTILQIIGGSKDGAKVWTKNYISDLGVVVRGF
jgi:hypothetical protein